MGKWDFFSQQKFGPSSRFKEKISIISIYIIAGKTGPHPGADGQDARPLRTADEVCSTGLKRAIERRLVVHRPGGVRTYEEGFGRYFVKLSVSIGGVLIMTVFSSFILIKVITSCVK